MPDLIQMRNEIFTRYRTMIGQKFSTWPIGGPDNWLTTWEDIMKDCEFWCPEAILNWEADMNLI